MFKKLKELLSDAGTYGASGMLAQLIGFFLLPLYTRYLTPADYGITALLQILSALFLPLVGLGMTNAIFRRFNVSKTDQERRVLLSTGLVSVAVASVILAATSMLFAAPLSSLVVGEAKYSTLVKLTLLTGVMSAISEVPRVILRADRRVKLTLVINLICLLVGVAVMILLVVGLRWGVFGLVLGGTVGSLVAMLLLYGSTWRSYSFAFNYETWKQMLSYGLPFLPHRLFAFGMAQFGQYMVAHMIGLEQAGLYSIAVRVSMPVAFVVMAVQRAWEPYKFQIHARDSDPAAFFRSVTTYYVGGIFYLGLGVSVWGPEVIRLMTTAGFRDASMLVPAVAFISVSQGLYFMLGTGIELSDDMRRLPLVSLSGLAALVLSALLLVPAFGAKGAALATIVGWCVMAAVILHFSHKVLRIGYDWPILRYLSGLALFFVVLGMLAQNAPWGIRIPLAVFLCCIYPVLAIQALNRSPVECGRVQALQLRLKGGVLGEF